jgi:hypothetical protein
MPTLSISPLAADAVPGFTSCANAALAESVATNAAALMVLKALIKEIYLRIRI